MYAIVSMVKAPSNNVTTDNLPTITDWLLVLITFVYVAATILISIFNYRSAKAAREQIKESQVARQQNMNIQNQNVGINFYDRRIEVLEKIREGEMNEVALDISLLFGSDFYDRLKIIIKLSNDLNFLRADESRYLRMLKEEDKDGEILRQLRDFEYSVDDYRANEQDADNFEAFCSKHAYSFTDEVTGDITEYNYLYIKYGIRDVRIEIRREKESLEQSMQEFIKASISTSYK